MNISKISRSLVVILFLALIIFISYNDVILIIQNNNSSTVASSLIKVFYAVAIVLLVVFYRYIKDKLNRKKVKRNISLCYRYIYMVFITIAMSIISIYKYLYLINNNTLFIYLTIKLLIAIVLKKVIFNVSKSDILSVLGMFLFSMIPCSFYSTKLLFLNLINTFIFVLMLLFMQYLIDELKQKGIKNKKYMIISVILGIFISACILFNISGFVWILLAILSFVVTCNLDTTHITFPKKVVTTLNSNNKDFVYKIERINISKLLVSVLIIVLATTFLVFISRFIISNIDIEDEFLKNIFISRNILANIDFNNAFSNLVISANQLLSNSKIYYLVILVYIAFIEVLSFVLHRRYDTKSTLMKLIFIFIYLSISVFNLNILYFQNILTVLLLLITIVNTSNIYLNREERIKLLVA